MIGYMAHCLLVFWEVLVGAGLLFFLGCCIFMAVVGCSIMNLLYTEEKTKRKLKKRR